MEYLVIANDGTDVGAKQRRLKARAAHLQNAEALKAAGKFINGGALLDDQGEMIGSALLMDFPTRQELDECLQQDPYVTGEVWKEIDVKPVRLVFRS